jgi:hypothetical protein
MIRICSPSRADAVAAPFEQIWHSNSLYSRLRDAAIAAYPDSFEDAFRQLCVWARHFTTRRQFVLWATDFRRREDAELLRALAALDVDKFLSDGQGPPPLAPLELEEFADA